jgi:hypothetical protein
MRSRIAILASLSAVACTSAAPEPSPDPLFDHAQELLDAAQLELVTLDPSDVFSEGFGPPPFSEYEVLGRAVITDAEERRALVLALDDAIDRADEKEAKCEFFPHHAYAARTGNQSVEIAICFTCGEAYVYRQDEAKKRYKLARERNAAVEAIVDRHGLPRGPHAPRAPEPRP